MKMLMMNLHKDSNKWVRGDIGDDVSVSQVALMGLALEVLVVLLVIIEAPLPLHTSHLQLCNATGIVRSVLAFIQEV